MRPLLIAIFTVIWFSAFPQHGQIKVFKKTEFINGVYYRQLYDTVKIGNEKIDIYFLSLHFYSPYYLPVKFIDNQKKNQILSVWRYPKDKKSFEKNWENIYTYDSLGRVIKYSYSGCFICSNFPYDYSVTYNSNKQVTQIDETKFLKDSYKFYYDKKGDIVKFEKYIKDKVEIEITLVN